MHVYIAGSVIIRSLITGSLITGSLISGYRALMKFTFPIDITCGVPQGLSSVELLFHLNKSSNSPANCSDAFTYTCLQSLRLCITVAMVAVASLLLPCTSSFRDKVHRERRRLIQGRWRITAQEAKHITNISTTPHLKSRLLSNLSFGSFFGRKCWVTVRFSLSVTCLPAR